jgi:hypothetical protein
MPFGREEEGSERREETIPIIAYTTLITVPTAAVMTQRIGHRINHSKSR